MLFKLRLCYNDKYKFVTYLLVSHNGDRDAFRLRLAALDIGFEGGVYHDANDV